MIDTDDFIEYYERYKDGIANVDDPIAFVIG